MKNSHWKLILTKNPRKLKPKTQRGGKSICSIGRLLIETPFCCYWLVATKRGFDDLLLIWRPTSARSWPGEILSKWPEIATPVRFWPKFSENPTAVSLQKFLRGQLKQPFKVPRQRTRELLGGTEETDSFFQLRVFDLPFGKSIIFHPSGPPKIC